MKPDDEIDQAREIYQYRGLKYIEQWKVLCPDERYYEVNLRDMEWNQFHLYDLSRLSVDN
jgi:hypothetical protein